LKLTPAATSVFLNITQFTFTFKQYINSLNIALQVKLWHSTTKQHLLEFV